MICGFIAFDAPARVRVRWQLCCAPAVGILAALGVLTSQTVPTAILGMAGVATLGGYAVAVSLRMAIVGLSLTAKLRATSTSRMRRCGTRSASVGRWRWGSRFTGWWAFTITATGSP
jgi:hypothetical protein